MADISIKIKSILDGQQSGYYVGGENEFLDSLGIDPDLAATGSQVKSSGMITPATYTAFSGANVNSGTIALITNPKDALVYAVLDNGRLISYDSVLGSETLIGTVTGSEAHGGFYYNNFIYITGTGTNHDDISRYGPLDGTPTITNGVWTGSTLGSQTKLVDTTYPSFGNVEYPNHWGHVHVDSQAYFCDFASGRGLIHAIKTTPTLDYDAQSANFTLGLVVTGGTSGATATILADNDGGTTGTLTLTNIIGVFQNDELITDSSTGSATVNGTIVEGAGDNGSAYNVLDLPLGYLPTDIESYGTDLIISALQTTDSVLNQGPSALFLWDPTDVDSFYRQVDLEEFPLTTALQNKGGTIYVFSGNRNSGHSIGVYDGAYNVQPLEFFADGYSPFAGGVAVYGNRISWGSQRTFKASRGCVYSMGYKSPRFPSDAVHNTARSSITGGTTPTVSAISYVQQASGIFPRLVMASRSSSQFKIDELKTSGFTQSSEITFGPFTVGQPFKVKQVRIPLSQVVSSGVVITPAFKFDDSNSYALDTINNANFPGARNILYKQFKMSETKGGIQAKGDYEFTFGLSFDGTVEISALLPIEIILTVQDIDDK